LHHRGLTVVDDAHPAFHPPQTAPHTLPLILTSTTNDDPLELDNRLKSLEVATCKRNSNVHRKQMASSQHSVRL
jgi:hypothetical protein